MEYHIIMLSDVRGGGLDPTEKATFIIKVADFFNGPTLRKDWLNDLAQILCQHDATSELPSLVSYIEDIERTGDRIGEIVYYIPEDKYRRAVIEWTKDIPDDITPEFISKIFDGQVHVVV